MITDLDYLPCSNDPNAKCSTCSLHGNDCPVEMPYNVVKAVYPIKTTPKAGANVQQLVQVKFPKQYKDLHLNAFDWNDLDGVLDFLYGERKLGLLSVIWGISKTSITEIINLIESNCEVKLND